MACCVLVLGGNIIQYDDMIIDNHSSNIIFRKMLAIFVAVIVSKQNIFASLEIFAQLWAGVMLVVA